jgi:hypothetical protein
MCTRVRSTFGEVPRVLVHGRGVVTLSRVLHEREPTPLAFGTTSALRGCVGKLGDERLRRRIRRPATAYSLGMGPRPTSTKPAPDAAQRPVAMAHELGLIVDGGRVGDARLESHGEVLERNPLHVIEGGRRKPVSTPTRSDRIGWVMTWDLNRWYDTLTPQRQRAAMRRLGTELKKIERRMPAFESA